MTEDPAPIAETLREELRQVEILHWRLGQDPGAGRVEHLVEEVLQPLCGEAQADGVPCRTSADDCEHCVRALAHVRALRAALELAAARAERLRPDPRDP